MIGWAWPQTIASWIGSIGVNSALKSARDNSQVAIVISGSNGCGGGAISRAEIAGIGAFMGAGRNSGKGGISNAAAMPDPPAANIVLIASALENNCLNEMKCLCR